MAVALVRMARRVPAWRRVLALADQALPQLLTLWRRLLRRTRSRLRQRRLVAALETHVLEAQAEVSQVLETLLDQPARQALTTRGLALAIAAAEATQDDIEHKTGLVVGGVFATPESRYGLLAYVGAQVRDIVQTTQRTVRQTLRSGTQQGLSVEVLAREIRATIGLTPAQARARETLRAKLEAQGKTPTEVQSALNQATELALQRRARLMAETQAVTLGHLGQQAAWEAVVQRGRLQASQVRRYWVYRHDEKVCVNCPEIPDMNPDGVDLYTPFETPYGPLMTPSAHPSCRCSVEYRVVP